MPCYIYRQVELLLKSWADVEQADAAGVTPLLGAVLAGATDCVELLLAAGGNWRVEDNNGRTIATADEVGSQDTRSKRLDAIKLVELWAAAHPEGPSSAQQRD